MRDWRCMIGIPFELCDCRQLVGRVLAELGRTLPGPALWSASPADMAGVHQYLRAHRDGWEQLGDWPIQGMLEEGDVVLAIEQGAEVEQPHLGVVIDPRACVVLTTLRGLGSCIMPLRAVQGRKSVWRLRA